MKSITIKGSKRESVGKVATKALRNAGMVPCVIYGGGKSVHFSSEELAFRNLVYTPNVYTATINIDGEKTSAILKDIQFHPVTDKIIHVDFYQLFEDKEITMNIPVRLTGKSKGVAIGGSLRHTVRKMKIKALPSNLPDSVEADITDLQIGDKLDVTSFKSDKFTIMHADNTVVAQVRMSRNASKDEDEETTTEEGAEAAAPEAAAE